MNMHWWNLNTKYFRRFSAIKNIFWQALGLGGTLTQNLFGRFSYQEYLLTCIGGTWTQNLLRNFQLSRTLIDMPWWDLNTESSQQFSAIKNTYWHALVGPWHKILSAYFSYQENLLTCIDRTLAQFLFSDWQRSKILMVMHWWDLKPKFFQRFSANKNTYEHALVEP